MHWLKEHVVLLAIISAVLGAIALMTGAIVAIRLPADYFTQPASDANSSEKSNATSHLAIKILKNIVGVILILLGGVLSVPLVPGPGILILLMGLMLTSFPWKRKLELKLLRTRFVLSPVNWMRQRAGQPPIQTV